MKQVLRTSKLDFKDFRQLVIEKNDQAIQTLSNMKTNIKYFINLAADSIPYKHLYETKLIILDFIQQNKKNISIMQYVYLQIYFNIHYYYKFSKTIIKEKAKLSYLSLLTIISPKLNTKVYYKKRMHKDIDLKNPSTFNEKIQWLKLNYLYPNELVTKCADKVLVRNYITQKGCKEILNKCIGIYDKVEDINFEQLPQKFVLKWNFGCGYNIICTNKDDLNVKMIKKIIKKWGKSKFHLYNSELQYKNIKRKIICEEFINSKDEKLPEDYKFYCFNGKAEYVMICSERETEKPKYYFLDRNWDLVELNYQTELAKKEKLIIPKPKNIEKMFKYADLLSEKFPFVRVDLYNTNGKIYFGELTFTPSAGLDKGYTKKGDRILASKIELDIW